MSAARLLPLVLLSLTACGGAASSPDIVDLPTDAAAPDIVDLPADAAAPDAAPSAPPSMLPGFRVAGVWHGGGRDGTCAAALGRVTCTVPGLGHVVLEGSLPTNESIHAGLSLTAALDAPGSGPIEAVDAVADLDLPGANAWISNGFQSWSQSGALAIGRPVDDTTLDAALTMRGDGEVLRDGRALSWTYTAIGGGDVTFEAVVDSETSRRAKGWFQVSRAPDGRVRLRMAAGGDGDVVSQAAFKSMWHTGIGADQAEGRRKPLTGWNSWYELYGDVDETAVRDNAARMAEIAAAHPSLSQDAVPTIVIDDGWQQGWGTWIANEKFPDGFTQLSADLAGQGFGLGLWLAPLLVAATDPLVAAHPDWFLPDTTYPHLVHGDMRVLDVTHPEALAHLLDALRALSDQGVRLFKLDFLFVGTWPATRRVPMPAMAAYTQLWAAIRAALPPETTLVAVGAPPLPTLEYVDAWRVGGDIAVPNFGVSFAFLPNQLRSLAARQTFCAARQCDADPILLRGLTQDEVEFGAAVVAAAGGGLFLSDDLRVLPPERLDWGLTPATLSGAVGNGAAPESLFPADPPESLVSGFVDAVGHQSRHVVPTIWRFFDRRVAFNPADAAIEVEGVAVPPHAVRPLP